MTGKVVSVQKTVIFYWYYAEFWPISTDMQQITDIAYRPICIGKNDYRYRYIGFADMSYIGRYFISADTNMPTLVLGLDLVNFGIFLPYFMGSRPGFGSFWAIFALFRGILDLDLAHFELLLGVPGLDLAHFGPLKVVLNLDLAYFGPFLPYIYSGGSGPGFGPFWASNGGPISWIFALFREFWTWIWDISVLFRGFWAWIWPILPHWNWLVINDVLPFAIALRCNTKCFWWICQQTNPQTMSCHWTLMKSLLSIMQMFISPIPLTYILSCATYPGAPSYGGLMT